MRQIKTMTKEELLMGSVDLISKTNINLSRYFEERFTVDRDYTRNRWDI